MVAATGTHERVIPVPGWTTPGVLGLAATTILLKAQQMVPGEATIKDPPARWDTPPELDDNARIRDYLVKSGNP